VTIDFWATLRAQLREHEGVRLMPYTDTVGKTTIGVGRNLSDNGISQATCDQMLDEDIGHALEDLQTFAWFAELDEVRQRVLIDMVFNIGLTRLRGFTRMLTAVESGDYDEAATQMLDSRWAAQVVQRAARLAGMMRTGCAP
jgi:lysozyme